ncbi:MAG: glycerate kinase [Eubacteriales bacterium]|nr:glycerate kinase [Eubacteriales bacterium]
MKIVVAMDSFKGSMSSMEAGRVVRKAAHMVDEELDVDVFPLADGGEGTMETLIYGLGGRIEKLYAVGPLGAPVPCEYGIVEDQKLAIIEMAKVAGLTLVPEETRMPFYTTTYGVGELIRHAIGKGCRKFIIGIGGSATNDGGIGMLQALGFGLVDQDGRQVQYGAIGLSELAMITTAGAMPELAECEFQIACDVKNPLCGENGCSYVFAPQKGATKEQVELMDQWLLQYAQLAKTVNPKANRHAEGAGAAGGMGFAFCTFLNGTLESGSEIVARALEIEDAIQEADLVITGEGCLDGQSAMGKGPLHVASIAKKYNKKVVALVGSVGEGASMCHEQGVDAYFPIVQRPMQLQEAMEPVVARGSLEATMIQVLRLLAE